MPRLSLRQPWLCIVFSPSGLGELHFERSLQLFCRCSCRAAGGPEAMCLSSLPDSRGHKPVSSVSLPHLTYNLEGGFLQVSLKRNCLLGFMLANGSPRDVPCTGGSTRQGAVCRCGRPGTSLVRGPGSRQCGDTVRNRRTNAQCLGNQAIVADWAGDRLVCKAAHILLGRSS